MAGKFVSSGVAGSVLRLSRIVAVAATLCGESAEMIRGQRRYKHLVRVRAAIVVVARSWAEAPSYPRIAAAIGIKDHTSVRYLFLKGCELLNEGDEAFSLFVLRLSRQMGKEEQLQERDRAELRALVARVCPPLPPSPAAPIVIEDQGENDAEEDEPEDQSWEQRQNVIDGSALLAAALIAAGGHVREVAA